MGGVEHLLRNATLEVSLPGVYQMAGTKDAWERRLMAACLWGGPQAVASLRSAAALHKLNGFERSPVEISTAKRGLLKHKGVSVHRFDVASSQTTRVDGIPVTDAHRTLRDLLPVLEPGRQTRGVSLLVRGAAAA